jgi:hypothetical protein
MSQTEKARAPTLMEKHIQTILLGIITAAILFGCSTIFTLSMQMATITVKIDSITESSKNFVTVNDMINSGKITSSQMMDFDKRLTKSENKIDALERHTK